MSPRRLFDKRRELSLHFAPVQKYWLSRGLTLGGRFLFCRTQKNWAVAMFHTLNKKKAFLRAPEDVFLQQSAKIKFSFCKQLQHAIPFRYCRPGRGRCRSVSNSTSRLNARDTKKPLEPPVCCTQHRLRINHCSGKLKTSHRRPAQRQPSNELAHGCRKWIVGLAL